MTIPKEGISHHELLETMDAYASGDADWRRGRTWCLVYYADDDHYALLKKAYEKFFSGNALNPMAFKSLKRMEAEVVRMTASMLNGDANVVGTMTSGGTESILMAVKAARERAGILRRAFGTPEIVAPTTIHPAFSKAAHYFGLKLRTVPVDENFRVRVDALESALSRKTVLIAASAPQYPHGQVDPIEEIGAIASKRNIPFHVDACFGGFILPWLEKLGHPVPVFDFRVDGVTSMSADVHKYGFAAKGASVVVYRDMSYLKHQFFVETEFPGGIYASPTMAGTRPGGAIAAAWASLRALGEDGYMHFAEKTLDAKNRLLAGIEERDGLEILGSEDATVVAFRTVGEGVDTYAVADQLQQNGWAFERQQEPTSLHCTVGPHNADVVDEFLADLDDATETVRSNPELASEGDAAMYGMMAKIPFRGMVRMSVLKVMEELYGPNAAEPDLSRITSDEDADPLLQLADRLAPKVVDGIDRIRDWLP